MPLYFNIEKSLELCPPENRKFPKCTPKELLDQIEFVERRIIDRNNVTYKLEDQIRSLGVVPEDVSEIKISLETHDYLHDEYPPVVIEDPDKAGRYIGKIGYNRNDAAELLGEKYFIYDVYRYKSPLAEFVGKIVSNQIYNPRKGNTKEDLIHQTLWALEHDLVQNDDDELKNLIDIIAADKSIKERKNILKGVRTYKTKFSHLRTYHCGKKGGPKSTKEAAKKFNLGWEGDKNLSSTGKLGYIPPYANPVTAFAHSEKLLKKYGFMKIGFTFFIPEPLPEPQLTKQRIEQLQKFNAELTKKAEFFQVLLGQFGIHKSLDDVIEMLPYEAVGFLPQHENPDPSKGGRPTEDNIVDVNGNPIFVENNTNVLKFGT